MNALPSTVRALPASEYLAEVDGIRLFDLGDSDGPPPPQEFVIGEYVPEGFVSTLYAKPGSAKSLLALYFAFHVVLGRDIFGHPVKKGTVLYLDAELDKLTFERRGWQIARGLGLGRPPRGISYYRLRAPLSNRAEGDRIRELIARAEPTLTIIDSFSAALRGRDSNSADDVTERYDYLEGFGTVLLIDHTAKSADIGGHVTALGSQGKMMFARSALFIASNGKACVLRHEKHNLSGGAVPVSFALSFSSEIVILDQLKPDDPRLEGIERAVPVKERVRAALLSREYDQGVSAKDLAEALEASPSTVSNALTGLKTEGVARTARGKWYPVT
jgi:biotin operon repressor